MSQAEHSEIPTIVIKPTGRFGAINWRELWRYRELLYFFIWRDIKVRYKQTILGATWAVLQPFTQMIIFSFIFGSIAQLDSDGIPYPVFTYTALIPWTFFARGLSGATISLTSHANMIKKVYFPRLVLPMSAILGGLVDLAIALSTLFLMMLYFGLPITPKILALPFLLLLALITCMGVSLWLAPMNVQFRDIRYAMPFITQVWLWLTPVAYSSSYLSEPWNTLYALNPMAGVVEGFRWALAGTDTQPGAMVLVSSVIAVLLLISGLIYFRSMETTFADVS